MAALVFIRFIVHDHDNLFIAAEAAHALGIAVLVYKLTKEKTCADEGTLCWNLLSSRLFFDAKMSDEINKAIKACIQRTLSNMRTPAYMGEITLADSSLGKLPPHVPLSLAIKISYVRGILRIHLKPPPSDQLWYGFTSMLDLEWDLESSIGDRKITNSHIASLIGNIFKTLTILES